MKKFIGRTLAALGLVLGVSSLASAQGLPGSGWYTTTTIQNVGGGSADVTLEVYPQSSGNPSTTSFTLATGANKVFVPGGNKANGTEDVTPPLGANFAGSAVVSSNQPIVAIGQIGNNVPAGFSGLGTAGGFASGFFRGASSTATTLIYPSVKNNWGGKSTIFSIQAAGTDVTIAASIRSASGATHTFNGSIGANRAINLIPSSFTPAMPSTNCGTDVNTSPCFGALTVTATGGSIAGTVVEYVTGQSPATLAQAGSLFPSSEATNKVYCPTIKNEYTATQKRSTGLTVANVTGSQISVNVTFTVSAGANPNATYTLSNVSIPANGSVVFSKFGTGNSGIGGMPANNLASAVIETSTPNSIVAVVNEQNFGTTPAKATIYTCFSAASATTKIAAPLVKKNLAGSTSGPTVQNVGSSSFTVAAQYVCNTGTFNITSPSLAPGASYTFFNPSQVPDSSNCAVTLTGNGSIVAIIQETSDFASGSFANNRNLDTKNYEGFNLTP